MRDPHGSLGHALFYLRRGLAPVPVRPAGKEPLVRWQRFQKERPPEWLVRRWYARWPGAGVGVVTGAVSDLVVLDVDRRHGGEDSLEALERRFGPLPETVEVETGGGGRHFWFRHPGGYVPNRVGLRPGLDLRGDGGLVVAPPSLHPSGRHYVFEVDHHLADREPAPLPQWLLALEETPSPGRGHPRGYWRRLVAEGVREGERNVTIASLTGHLLWHGVDPAVIEELLQCWNLVRCRPPLDPAEVSRTVRSILRTYLRRRGLSKAAGEAGDAEPR
ncbi:hypothetical protein HRbin39_00476 [bacterium HR39]|nr:hypothetical protein HRbin39_00476 [bacterium HR39]